MKVLKPVVALSAVALSTAVWAKTPRFPTPETVSDEMAQTVAALRILFGPMRPLHLPSGKTRSPITSKRSARRLLKPLKHSRSMLSR